PSGQIAELLIDSQVGRALREQRARVPRVLVLGRRLAHRIQAPLRIRARGVTAVLHSADAEGPNRAANGAAPRAGCMAAAEHEAIAEALARCVVRSAAVGRRRHAQARLILRSARASKVCRESLG